VLIVGNVKPIQYSDSFAERLVAAQKVVSDGLFPFL